MLIAKVMQTIKHRLSTLVANRRLLKNTSWMLAAEGVSRLSRLLTIIVLGLCLSPVEYGTAMLAIICHELLRVFTRVGSGAKVIQCQPHELPAFASNASLLQWLLCLGLTAIQIATADLIAHYYRNPELALPLKIMALSNLLYPLVAVRVFLVQRENNLRYFAFATALSVTVENLGTAAFALMGLGVMSVALAKLCSALCWVIIFYRVTVTTYPLHFCWHTMKRLTSFASKILSSELLKSARLQIDSLFAARILSPELFGLYSFAKSAGVGLSQSLSAGYLNSLYPHLCEQLRQGSIQTAIKNAYRIAAGIAVLFILQAALAPFYLQLLFGSQWQDAALLVSILCLSAIPTLCLDMASTIYRAQNQAHYEVFLALYSVITLGLALVIVQPETPVGFAGLVTITGFSWPVVLLWVETRGSVNVAPIKKTAAG